MKKVAVLSVMLLSVVFVFAQDSLQLLNRGFVIETESINRKNVNHKAVELQTVWENYTAEVPMKKEDGGRFNWNVSCNWALTHDLEKIGGTAYELNGMYITEFDELNGIAFEMFFFHNWSDKIIVLKDSEGITYVRPYGTVSYPNSYKNELRIKNGFFFKELIPYIKKNGTRVIQ